MATLLRPTILGVSTSQISIGLTTRPDGVFVVSAGTKGRERQLTFVPVADGDIQLTRIDARVVTNSPGPVGRSLRRVG